MQLAPKPDEFGSENLTLPEIEVLGTEPVVLRPPNVTNGRRLKQMYIDLIKRMSESDDSDELALSDEQQEEMFRLAIADDAQYEELKSKLTSIAFEEVAMTCVIAWTLGQDAAANYWAGKALMPVDPEETSLPESDPSTQSPDSPNGSTTTVTDLLTQTGNSS